MRRTAVGLALCAGTHPSVPVELERAPGDPHVRRRRAGGSGRPRERDVGLRCEADAARPRCRGTVSIVGRGGAGGKRDAPAFIADDAGVLQVGDVLRCGISHPCTAFDKRSLIPVLDDEDVVVDAVRTLF